MKLACAPTTPDVDQDIPVRQTLAAGGRIAGAEGGPTNSPDINYTFGPTRAPITATMCGLQRWELRSESGRYNASIFAKLSRTDHSAEELIQSSALMNLSSSPAVGREVVYAAGGSRRDVLVLETVTTPSHKQNYAHCPHANEGERLSSFSVVRHHTESGCISRYDATNDAPFDPGSEDVPEMALG
ncbi:hypothetical protein J6590_071206 [Homalodisca vitripennis]|nr:hypothetical protein J6590_071206 [Homalodisca vitripennis]